MPVIGLGTWQCSEEEARLAVKEALKAGCEKGVGQGLDEWIREEHGDRKELFVVTKLPPNAIGLRM